MLTHKSQQNNQYKKQDKKKNQNNNISFNTILLNEYFTIY